MDKHANQFAPVTPIDPSRSGTHAMLKTSVKKDHPQALALSAHYRAQGRGFVRGGEMQDGLVAESELAAAQGADAS